MVYGKLAEEEYKEIVYLKAFRDERIIETKESKLKQQSKCTKNK
jgi:hypothetical protein